MAIEAKSGMTLSPEQYAGLQKLQTIITDIPLRRLLIYGGDTERVFKTINTFSWRDFTPALGL